LTFVANGDVEGNERVNWCAPAWGWRVWVLWRSAGGGERSSHQRLQQSNTRMTNDFWKLFYLRKKNVILLMENVNFSTNQSIRTRIGTRIVERA
jgi:hypothetical protein